MILRSDAHALALDSFYAARDDDTSLFAINIFRSADAQEIAIRNGDAEVTDRTTASILYHSRKIKTWALKQLEPTFAEAAHLASTQLQAQREAGVSLPLHQQNAYGYMQLYNLMLFSHSHYS